MLPNLKHFWLWILIFSIFLILGSCSLSDNFRDNWGSSVNSWEKYQEKLSDEERINLIKDRRKELDTIRKGDYYSLTNNPDEALTYYLSVAERLPNDVLIQKKIGHAYFMKKDWVNAYNSYKKTPIWELSEKEKSEFFSSLFFDESQHDRLGEIYRANVWTWELEYYQILDACHTGVHNCILSIEAYSGANQDIIGLKNATQNAQKISPDYQYRNFVVATELYKRRAFRASSLIWKEIITTNPDYLGVEKLLGFSYYEIGNYPDAQRYLLSYIERASDDSEAMSRIGDVFFAQSNFATANLYYNNAILAGYKRKIDIERKLAYSYAKLSDSTSMTKVLSYLVTESWATADDAVAAISLALQNGENLKAYVWATNAVKRYPDSEQVLSLYITTMRVIGKTQDTLLYIDSLPSKFANLPIVLLEKWIILMENGDREQAKGIFETVKNMDQNAEFATEAANYIDIIQSQIETQSGVLEPSFSESGVQTPWWQ